MKKLFSLILILFLCSCEINFVPSGKNGDDSPHQHTLTEWISKVDATCVDDGVLGHYNCTSCGKNFDFLKEELLNITIPALGHDFAEEIILEATDENDGLKLLTCNRCGITKEEIIPANNKVTKSNLTIIEMNDVHGYIMQDENGRQGLSNMAYLVDEIREDVGKDNVLLVANGDMFQGTGLVKMSYGEILIDALGAMGLDACCLGNHEFDWDLPVILKYFDGDKENGEAKFPLINSNVYQDGKLVSGANIFETRIFDRGGVKIGFIGYIGNVKNSINALFVDKYDFDLDFMRLTRTIGLSLKALGADIILVSIHDGDANGIEKYEVNQTLAKLRDNDGNYLVDAVINGHTHTYQEGSIDRAGGVAMPVIQSNGYSGGQIYSFGRIDLEIENKKVKDFHLSHITSRQANANYNKEVQEIIDEYYEKDKEYLTTVLTTATYDISRYSNNTYAWVANVMNAATGADIAICNCGGLRTSLSNGKLMFEDLYQFNPFDNHIIIHEADANAINNLVEGNDYYFYAYSNEKKTSGKYKVAIVDYAYYNYRYKNYRSSDMVDTNIILRDALIMDLKLRTTFNVNKDYQAKIGLLYDPSSLRTYFYFEDKKHILIFN